MEERDRKTELLVGLFMLIGMLMLAGLILEFSTIREHFKNSYHLTVPLPDASGIKEGSPVMLGGSRVGRVASTPVLNDKFNGVVVTLNIDHDKRVPSDAKFGPGTAGLMGDSFIEIKASGKPTNQYIEPNTVVPPQNIAGPSGLSAIQDSAKEITEQADKVLDELHGTIKEMREAMKKVYAGPLSEASSKDLASTITHLNQLMTRLDEKALGENSTADLSATIASLREASRNIDEQAKRIGPMFDKLDPALSKVDKVVTDADKVMITAENAMQTLEKSVSSIGGAAQDIRGGQGLLPALLSDSELKNEFRRLITNLRQHGVIFYRDTAEQQEKERATKPPYTPGR